MNIRHATRSETIKRYVASGAVPLAIVSEALVAYVDLNTGTAPLFEIFYILPISVAAWFSGINVTLALAVISGLLRASAHASGLPEAQATGIYIYNVIEAIVLFACVGYFITKIKAHLDGLTSANEKLREVLSERALALAELKTATEASEAANIAKSRFLATMSHEFRTPLNGVLGMAQVIEMVEQDDADRRESIQVLKASAQTLLDMVNKMLDFSKFDTGALSLNSGTFDPAQLLRDVGTQFSRLAMEKSIKLESNWSSPLGDLYVGDFLRIRQMLNHLIANAIKFTANGTVSIGGSASLGDDGRIRLDFSVSDTGIGISEVDQHHLFKAFSQLDSSDTRKHGGIGLGLSLVKTLAESMGGEVGVESEPGMGSRFWFRVIVEQYSNGIEVAA